MSRPHPGLRAPCRLLSLAALLVACSLPASAAPPEALSSQATARIAWRVPVEAFSDAGTTARPEAVQTLAPGQSLALLLAPRQLLRWNASADGLHVLIAEDGHLFRDSARATGDDRRAPDRWLLPAAHPRQVILDNKSEHSLTLQLWIGELIDPQAAAPRVALAGTGGVAVRWREQPTGDIGHGRATAGVAPLQYTVRGPARVVLESFLRLGTRDARPAWSLVTQQNDETARTWHLTAPVDPLNSRRTDSVATSLARSVHLDFPAGDHRLAVSAEPAVVVRAFQGDGLLFAGNEARLYPQAATARARDLRFQHSREAAVADRLADVDPLWRALDPEADLLTRRARSWQDVEPASDGQIAFGWFAAAAVPDHVATGNGAAPVRMLRVMPGQPLRFALPETGQDARLEVAGDGGTRLIVRRPGIAPRGENAPEESFRLLGGTSGLHGRVLLADVRGPLEIGVDRPALVRLQTAQARGPDHTRVPTTPERLDAVTLLRDPAQAPSWLAPLAARLAARLPATATATAAATATMPTTAASTCRQDNAHLPADWQGTSERLRDAGQPDAAAALLVRAHQTCGHRTEASRRLAELLRDAGDTHAGSLLRQDDARYLDDHGRRAVADLREAFRRAPAWIELETLGARRVALGDARGLALVGEALVQQDATARVPALCGALAATGVEADSALLAHACREVAAGRDGTPWLPLVAVDGEAAGLRVLEHAGTGQRTSRFLATKDQPLALRIPGPRLLRIEIRRLAGADTPARVPGWLAVTLDGKTRHLPITAGDDHSDWLPLGSAGQPGGVGQAQRFHVSIPAGTSQLRLAGDGQLLVGISMADPAWPDPLAGTGGERSDFLLAPALVDADTDSAPADLLTRMPATATDPASTRDLLRLAWWAEHSTGAEARAYRARLLAAAQAAPASAWRDRLLARTLHRYSWQRETRIVDSAGLRYLDLPAAGSPAQRLRRALVTGLDGQSATDAFDRDGAWLTTDSAPGVLVDGRAWQRLRVSLRTRVLPGDAPATATEVIASIDDRAVAQATLVADGTVQTLEFAVPTGMHRAVLRLAPGDSEPYVQALVEGFDGRLWETLSLQGDRAFLVSRADTPVCIAVDSAEWLRIDESVAGRLQTRYHFQEGPGTLVLAPAAGATERVLRVYSLREESAGSTVPSPRPAPVPVPPQPPVAGTLAALAAPPAWQRLPDDAAGTATRALPTRLRDDALVVQQARQTELDEGLRAAHDATTLSLVRRQRLAKPGLWWRGEALLRATDGPDTTIGSTQLLEWRPATAAWYAQLEGSAWALQAAGASHEQSALATARWRLEHDIDRVWAHRVNAEFFVRALSADNLRGATVSDPDIWSAWKDAHRHGLRVSERWRWQPVADALLQVEYGLNGNEAGAPPLDSAWLSPSARLWWRGVAIDAGYRWQTFRQDNDRATGFNREWLDFGATWHVWRARGGWSLGAAWRQELRRDESSITLTAGWTWGAGPRAWLPSELPFRPLETRAADRAAARDRLVLDADHAAR